MDHDFEDNSRQPVYTDPNADVVIDEVPTESQASMGSQSAAESATQSYSYQAQDNPQQGQGGFNPQYHYSQSYDQHTEMNQGMDTSPMSVTDWLLTILASVIPCAGIILYFIWAFSKTGNLNRRNFCRAQLIVMGILFVLNMILLVILALFVFGYGGRMGAGMYYY